jgi:dipeptidyl aminopeptidase/acylaminoacyl peptidase
MLRPITVDEVASFPYAGVDECNLSADGLRIAYTHRGQIYITDLETSNTSEAFKGRSPKWSPSQPDGLAFLKPEGSGVWLRYIDGTERQLGRNTQDVDFVQWSFDGQFIALIVNREVETPDEDNDEDIVIVCPPPLTSVSEIVIIHVDTDEVIFLTESNVGESYEGLAWHPEGNWLTVYSSIESQDQSDTDWCLFDIDRRSGNRKDRIGPGKNEMTLPSWSPCGNFLALGYSPYSYIHPVRNLCAIMERDSKQVRILNDEYFIDFVCWGDDGQKIYCSGLKGISRHVFCVDIKSDRKAVVVERTGWTYLSGISRDGRTLLTVFRGLLSLPDVYVVSIDSGQERAVTQFSNQLANYELGDASVVEWESYDGLMIQGSVVSPLGKPMSPEHPTIVDVHGGPTEGGAAIFYREWHWLAANGFQIFAPDMRGSQQYQWCEPPTQEPDYKDVMSGIDWLASQRMCDKANIGVHGYSYGAILGAYAIGKSTLFRAAVLLGGLYDYRLTCQFGRQTRWNAISAQETGGAPWEVPHLYQELSPISYVANVETPALILEGEHDTPHEAELYTTYLRALGKEVTYVLYKGAGHSLSKASHRKDRWERTLGWFRKYLIKSN